VAISWFLRDIGDTRWCSMEAPPPDSRTSAAPSHLRDDSLTNGAPVGDAFNDEIMR
jgi:hypothetical protein